MGLSGIISKINGSFSQKLHISHLHVFDSLLMEFPLEFCNGRITEKTRVIPLRDGGKSDNICIHLDTIPE